MTGISADAPRDTLRYGVADTPIGIVLAALSDHGVAAILIGDDRSCLHRALSDALPGSDLIEDHAATADALARIGATIADPRRPLDLALDVRGSRAEQAVWTALRAIPAGETRNYGQVARALPIAMTARDVGAACAANVLALAIPCHRVIKADGSISGYRWGVARKRRLLQLEAAA